MDLFEVLHVDDADRGPGHAVLVFPTGDVDADGLVRFTALVRRLPLRLLLVRPRAEWVPHVSDSERARVHEVAPGVQLVDLRFGYDDVQDVPAAIRPLVGTDEADRACYYVVDDCSVSVPLRGMARWRALLFRRLVAASVAPAEWFRLPPQRTTTVAPRTARAAHVFDLKDAHSPAARLAPSAGGDAALKAAVRTP